MNVRLSSERTRRRVLTGEQGSHSIPLANGPYLANKSFGSFSMSTGSIMFAGCGKCDCQIHPKSCFSTSKRRVESLEGMGEDCDRLSVSEPSKSMTPPAIEMSALKKQERERWVKPVGWQQAFRRVERAYGIVAVAGSRKAFAVCGCEPRAE